MRLRIRLDEDAANAGSEDMGLARSRPSDNKHRPLDLLDGATLGGVEPVQFPEEPLVVFEALFVF